MAFIQAYYYLARDETLAPLGKAFIRQTTPKRSFEESFVVEIEGAARDHGAANYVYQDGIARLYAPTAERAKENLFWLLHQLRYQVERI